MASKWKWTETAAGKAVEGKNGFVRFIGWLNSLFNENHAWFDYGHMNNVTESFIDRSTGADLTPAEKAANQFSAEEAQKQRDWEEYMSNTAYQRQVKDMQAAGINPAMAMNGSSGASTPSGSSASSVSPQSGMSMSDIMQLFLMPMQKKLMQAQAQQARDSGQAALIQAGAAQVNAGANSSNARTNARNADTQRMEAETHRMEVQIKRDLAEHQIEVYQEDVKRIAEQTAYISLQRQQLPEYLELAKKNADAQSKHAIAALEQAHAAVQNAATNDRLADYETSLKYAQEQLTWYQSEGQKVISQYLPEKTRVEIDNLIKEGVRLDAQGRLINKTGHLIDAQTVKTYVNCATDISNAVNKWINPLSGASLPTASDWFTSGSVGAGAGVQMFGGF